MKEDIPKCSRGFKKAVIQKYISSEDGDNGVS